MPVTSECQDPGWSYRVFGHLLLDPIFQTKDPGDVNYHSAFTIRSHTTRPALQGNVTVSESDFKRLWDALLQTWNDVKKKPPGLCVAYSI